MSIRLPWLYRLIMVAGGGVLVTLLTTAACLTPAERGFGTHQQLGLPPCSFKVLVGVRCPSCGMTTSWSHMMHGHVLRSFQSNAGGAMLAIVSLLVGPWSIVAGISGRWLWPRPGEWAAVAIGTAVITVTVIDWCVRCYLDG